MKQLRAGSVLLLLMVALLLPGCSLTRLEVTEVSKQFLKTAEHVPGFLGATTAAPLPEGDDNIPTEIPQWGISQGGIGDSEQGDETGTAGIPEQMPNGVVVLPATEPPTPTNTPTRLRPVRRLRLRPARRPRQLHRHRFWAIMKRTAISRRFRPLPVILLSLQIIRPVKYCLRRIPVSGFTRQVPLRC